MSTEQDLVCQTVSAWLQYKSLVGLKGQLSESMLNVPIAEFLAARHGSEVTMEVPHPLFKKASRRRPKQIDFVRKKRNEKTWHSAIEFKYQSDTPQRLIDDICRLVTLAQCRESIGSPERLFLLAGERTTDKDPLDVRINSGDGGRVSVFQDIFRRINDENARNPLICNLKKLSTRQRLLFCEFCKGYDAKIPTQIETRLVGFGESGRYACSIWRMVSVKGSGLLGIEGFGI